MADTQKTADASSSTAATPADTSLGAKVNRILETHKSKIAKLTQDNRKLKEQLAIARNTGSRIRRIPRNETTEPEAPTN